MDKKRAKNAGGTRDDSLVKVPPSWQLTPEQQDFINDLLQDDTAEFAAGRPARPTVNE
ncbi:conserved hypothetical protein [Serratia proteamaculans]|uniref:hypothetical protein n=1 Tax=Serratia proteamaculans TaxID=28151 RepID=UPI0009F7FB73|nr:hypothetical protein [Serratia proteamaculans]SMB46018.1 conserved hypothetical protein [Serratia proteamaculans]